MNSKEYVETILNTLKAVAFHELYVRLFLLRWNR